MPKSNFDACWGKMNRTIRSAIQNVVESHMVTGRSINSIVKDKFSYAIDEDDFITGMIGFAKCYKKYRL